MELELESLRPVAREEPVAVGRECWKLSGAPRSKGQGQGARKRPVSVAVHTGRPCGFQVSVEGKEVTCASKSIPVKILGVQQLRTMDHLKKSPWHATEPCGVGVSVQQSVIRQKCGTQDKNQAQAGPWCMSELHKQGLRPPCHPHCGVTASPWAHNYGPTVVMAGLGGFPMTQQGIQAWFTIELA